MRISEDCAAARRDGDVEEAIALRMERQRVLYEPGRHLHFVIAAEALQHSFAPSEVMRGQLDRLVSASMLKTVTIGIVPMGREWPCIPWHGFWIFDDSTVLVETISAELTVTEPDEIRVYEEAFTQLAEASICGDVTRRYLLDLQSRLVD